MNDLLQPIVKIALEAGNIISKHYQSATEIEVTKKDNNSPLTKADLAADKYIQQKLQDLTPGIPILSEESTLLDYDIRKHWNIYWLIDPLDGTKGFIKKNDQFTVNIVLIKNHEPILGVVYNPATFKCYYATKGSGAFRINPDKTIDKIKCNDKIPESGLKFAISGDHPSDKMQEALKLFGKHTTEAYSSSIKFCLIAEGSVHVYPRLKPTSEWDTGAAQIVLTEAGGTLISLDDFKPIRYNDSESILNPSFIAFPKAMMKKFEPILEKISKN
jgi:3'(2'), 5'-bisphosphate nucleotidase